MKRLYTVALLAVLALLLAACGGEAEPANVNLSFEGTDALAFEPASASVPAGANVNVTLNSTGALEHNWVLVESDADVTATDLADRAINGATSGTVPGGESATFTFVAPDAGSYKFVCSIPGHAAAGMVGDFTVTN